MTTVIVAVVANVLKSRAACLGLPCCMHKHPIPRVFVFSM